MIPVPLPKGNVYSELRSFGRTLYYSVKGGGVAGPCRPISMVLKLTNSRAKAPFKVVIILYNFFVENWYT